MCAGQTVLVLGAAGGVGVAAVQISKVLGAKVVAVARGAEKAKLLKDLGADAVIDTSAHQQVDAQDTSQSLACCVLLSCSMAVCVQAMAAARGAEKPKQLEGFDAHAVILHTCTSVALLPVHCLQSSQAPGRSCESKCLWADEKSELYALVSGVKAVG